MSETAEAALRLRVSEAMAKDVARAVARLDPADMAEIGLQIGDIVEVTGKRATLAKVLPAYREQRGQARIQIDGVCRENAGTGLDQTVTIRKVAVRPAERIVLTAVTQAPRERDLKYIGSLLDGLPVVAGDRLRVTLFGSRSVDFKVASTAPKGPVVINPVTLLDVQKVHEEEARGLSPTRISGG